MSAFCTIADLAAFLQITIPYDSEPALRAIREASAAIESYCGQQLYAVMGDKLTLDGIGGRRLFLPELPVTAVTEVVVDGATLTEGDDYKLGQWGILWRIGARWPAGIQNIEVTYDHGYETIPDIIAAVCTRSAARSYQAGLRAAEMAGVPGVQGTTLGDYSVQYGSEGSAGTPNALGASAAPLLLPSEKMILNRYRMERP